MAEKKDCAICGKTFYKRGKAGWERWNHQRFCSQECRQKAKQWKLRGPRFCYACGKSRTHTRKSGKEDWILNHDAEDNVVCTECLYEVFLREEMLVERKKYIRFYDERVKLAENPRSGVCSLCRAKDQQTVMHHMRYDAADKAAYTIELCIACHKREHPLERAENGTFVKSSKK